MFNKLENKKGVSNIIATMSLVLLSIIAVGVLWGFVKTTIDNIELSPEISCLDMKTKSTVKIQRACFNSQTKETQITLKRSLTGLTIESLEFATQKNKYQCGLSCNNGCTVLNDGTTKTYIFSSQENENQINLLYQDCLLDTKEIKNC